MVSTFHNVNLLDMTIHLSAKGIQWTPDLAHCPQMTIAAHPDSNIHKNQVDTPQDKSVQVYQNVTACQADSLRVA